MDWKGSPANILNVIYETEQPDRHKIEEAMGGATEERGARRHGNAREKQNLTKKKLKAFVRLQKRNRLNYYFLFIPFWELYLKL